MQNKYIVIMAGGAGTRFWPQSKNSKPKQFLDILGTGKTLIQETVSRFSKLVPLSNIYIITNEIYKDLCIEELPDLQEQQIICEPSRNNTAPCVAYATYKLFAHDKDAVIAVAPVDHLILDTPAFLRAVEQGLNVAQKQPSIVTLGIQPSRPDTGYGYIQFAEPNAENVSEVVRFVEKPNIQTAQEYLESKNYLWNAGIFIAKATTLMEAYQQFVPQIHQTFIEGLSFYNRKEETTFIHQHYPQTQIISFDYAIAEKAKNVVTIAVSCGWSDLGTWASLYDILDKDEHHNVCNVSKRVLLDSSNNMIQISHNKELVIKGLSDFIVVENQDALLIYPKNLEQEIKTVAEKLR